MVFVVVAVFASITASSCPLRAQLPVAGGRSIELSNSAWRVFIADDYQPREGNIADLLIHFHGDPQVMANNVKYANLNVVLFTVNYHGLSSVYSTPFSQPVLFQQVMDETLHAVRKQPDFPDNLAWDKVALSSFSAGYGAVREIIKSPAYRQRVDAILAADSMYATTGEDGEPLPAQMADYQWFAEEASQGRKVFLFTHSRVPTPDYESTEECGNVLLRHLMLDATKVDQSGLGSLRFDRHAQQGRFQLWGTPGSDGEAHMAHLRFIGYFLCELPLANRQQNYGARSEDARDVRSEVPDAG